MCTFLTITREMAEIRTVSNDRRCIHDLAEPTNIPMLGSFQVQLTVGI
jgi:hypothetical protein